MRRKLRLGLVFWGFLIPVVAVVAIVFAVRDVGPTWSAANGGGHPGTLVLQRKSCHRVCTWYGQFRSDDGTVVRESVRMREGVPAGSQVGDRLRARDTGSRYYVFAESGSFDWWGSVIIMVLSVGYLIVWAIVMASLARSWLRFGRRA